MEIGISIFVFDICEAKFSRSLHWDGFCKILFHLCLMKNQYLICLHKNQDDAHRAIELAKKIALLSINSKIQFVRWKDDNTQRESSLLLRLQRQQRWSISIAIRRP